MSKYRVKLDFTDLQSDLKIGMTGDSEITTGFKPDVVSVPIRSVLEKENGTYYVRVLKTDGTSYEERSVTMGMEGVAGSVEVTGVKEGETVVVLVKN